MALSAAWRATRRLNPFAPSPSSRRIPVLPQVALLLTMLMATVWYLHRPDADVVRTISVDSVGSFSRRFSLLGGGNSGDEEMRKQLSSQTLWTDRCPDDRRSPAFHQFIEDGACRFVSPDDRAARVYVCPKTGNDSFDGSFKRPVATIERAIERVRQLRRGETPTPPAKKAATASKKAVKRDRTKVDDKLRAEDKSQDVKNDNQETTEEQNILQDDAPFRGPITIFLRDGVHRMSRTVRLTEEDSGSSDAPLIIRGFPNEVAIISGATEIPSNKWQRVGNADQVLNGNVRDPNALARALVANISDIVSDPSECNSRGDSTFTGDVLPTACQLFVRGEPYVTARYPNSGMDAEQSSYETIAGVISPGGVPRTTPSDYGPATVKLPKGILSKVRYSHLDQLRLQGYWRFPWAFETLSVGAINYDDETITTSSAAHFGVSSSARFLLSDSLEELDSPGEMYHDRTANMLYYISRRPGSPIYNNGPQSANHNTAPPELSTFAGPFFATKETNHVTISCVTMERVRGTAVVIRGGSHVNVMHVAMRDIGGVAVRFGDMGEGASVEHRTFGDSMWDRGAGSMHAVVQSIFVNIGASAVVLGGGSRSSLTPGCNLVSQNTVRHFGTLHRTYRPAIWVDGVSNGVIGNAIAGGPHSAIILYGNDHFIEGNKIDFVCQETSDAGAIYAGRDWTAAGNVIRYNVLTRVGGAFARQATYGVYLDDLISGFAVYGNLFIDIQNGVFVGGGRANVVMDNVFYNTTNSAVIVDARGLTRDYAHAEQMHPDVETTAMTLMRRLRAASVESPRWSSRFPWLHDLAYDGSRFSPANNTVVHNLFIGQSAPLFAAPIAVSSGTFRMNLRLKSLEPEKGGNIFAFSSNVAEIILAIQAKDSIPELFDNILNRLRRVPPSPLTN